MAWFSSPDLRGSCCQSLIWIFAAECKALCVKMQDWWFRMVGSRSIKAEQNSGWRSDCIIGSGYWKHKRNTRWRMDGTELQSTRIKDKKNKDNREELLPRISPLLWRISSLSPTRGSIEHMYEWTWRMKILAARGNDTKTMKYRDYFESVTP
jgi:hypothetical protein